MVSVCVCTLCSGEYESVMMVSDRDIQLPLDHCWNGTCINCEAQLVSLSPPLFFLLHFLSSLPSLPPSPFTPFSFRLKISMCNIFGGRGNFTKTFSTILDLQAVCSLSQCGGVSCAQVSISGTRSPKKLPASTPSLPPSPPSLLLLLLLPLLPHPPSPAGQRQTHAAVVLWQVPVTERLVHLAPPPQPCPTPFSTIPNFTTTHH